MDDLVQGVASQTFALNGWDRVSSFTNIPYIYFFKNDNADDAGSASFMPAEPMRASFLRAVKEFPILLGHLVVARDGSASIHTDSARLNMPEYAESSSCIHYSAIEQAGFSWDALPWGLTTTDALTAADADGTIRFAHAHVVRLKRASGLLLFVSLSHYVVDGVGYGAFVNRWAEICRWMCAGAAAECLPCRPYSFDRADFARCLPGNTATLNKEMRRIYASPSCAGWALAQMSPAMHGSTLTTLNGLIGAKSHVFHITHAAVAALRESVLAHVPAGSRASDNDILTALVGCTIATAMQPDPDASWLWQALSSAARKAARMLAGMYDEFAIFLVLDIRSRAKTLAHGPAPYTGNCVTCVPIVHPMAQIAAPGTTTATLAAMCASVRAAVNSFDHPTIAALDAAMEADKASFGHIMVSGQRYPRKVVLSNQSRFTLYECDFGAGIPTWVSPLPTFYVNFASVLPLCPSSDGYDIYMTLETAVMERVAQNTLWALHTTLAY
ncbi:hypothetical protein H4R19_000017 [Coemansia spiralis]|nr:hypothetical protein H4R19_000017 [Coemansia spiralis]